MLRKILVIALALISLSACSSGSTKADGDAAAKANLRKALSAARAQLGTEADYGKITVATMNEALPKLTFQNEPSTSASVLSMNSSSLYGVTFAAKSDTGTCFNIRETSEGTDQTGTGSCNASDTAGVDWKLGSEGWAASRLSEEQRNQLAQTTYDEIAEANVQLAASLVFRTYNEDEDWNKVTVVTLNKIEPKQLTFTPEASTKPEEVSFFASANSGTAIAIKSKTGVCFVMVSPPEGGAKYGQLPAETKCTAANANSASITSASLPDQEG